MTKAEKLLRTERQSLYKSHLLPTSTKKLQKVVNQIAGKTIHKRHDTSRPQGVRGRNSDNSRLRDVLGWEPSIHLRQGLVPTYAWISGEVKAKAEREAGIEQIPTIAAQ